jgi:hypothetical protein
MENYVFNIEKHLVLFQIVMLLQAAQIGQVYRVSSRGPQL